MGRNMAGDLFGRDTLDDMEIVARRKVSGTVREALATPSSESFETVWQAALKLTFDGIPGDLHAGRTRRSGSREPWYSRGTEMCNERQISLVSEEELAAIGTRSDITHRLHPSLTNPEAFVVDLTVTS